MTMTERAHQFSEGDRVRTRQRVGRLPAGSIGTIQTVFTCDVLNVLFVGYRSPFLIYHDRLEAPPSNQTTNRTEKPCVLKGG